MINWNKYPYTDFHELNLDWVLKMIKSLDAEMDSFVNVNTIKYADPLLWNITSQYEQNTLVQDATGNTYLSKKPVPTGIPITNTEYWLKVADFSGTADVIRKSIADANDEASTTTSADRAVGELVWLSGFLYEVIRPMEAGDAYVFTGNPNVRKITIERLINRLTAADEAINGRIDNVNNALNSRIDDEIQNRTNEDVALGNRIDGIINEFNNDITLNNVNITGDISYKNPELFDVNFNSIKFKHNNTEYDVLVANNNTKNLNNYANIKNFGAVGDGIADDTDAIQAAVNQTEIDTIYFPPGKYHTTRSIILRDGIRITSSGINTVEMLNSFPTGTFTLANNIFIENINFETDNNESGFALYGDGCFGVNLNHVYSLGGFFNKTKSKFIKMVNSWHTLLMYDVIIDCGTVNGYAIELISDGNNDINKDVQMRNVFVDTWAATEGGCIYIDSALGVTLNDCIIRSHNYCINMVRTHGTGIATCDAEMTFFDTDITNQTNIFIGGFTEFNDYNSAFSKNIAIDLQGVIHRYDTFASVMKTMYGTNAFSWINQADAFITTNPNGTFNLIKPPASETPSGINLSIFGQNVPDNDTWAISCAISPNMAMKPFSKTGLALYESATGKIVALDIVANTLGVESAGVVKYQNKNTFDSDYYTMPYRYGNTVWLSISKTKDDYVFHVSNNGVAWLEVLRTPIAGFYCNPDKIGVMIDNENNEGTPFAIMSQVSQWQIVI